MKSRILLSIFFCLLLISAKAQTKFRVEKKETETWRSIYSLIDEKGRTLKVLDSAQYHTCMTGIDYGYFAIFHKKNSQGWTAIDANERVLFQVYNTSAGEPNPDYLIENKIRIVDRDNKIGFANEKGKIIIKPQFEIVSSFHNGKAIIGEQCKKVPWSQHKNENGCNHYSIICDRHGYINEKGEILKLGNYTFEELKKEIGWEPHEAY